MVFPIIRFEYLKMLISLFLLLVIQGFASSDDGYDLYRACEDILMPHINRTRGGIPDAEEVLFRCPLTKKFVDCRITRFETEYESQYNLGDYILVKNFLDEMCDENSQLHKVYAANVECYRSMVNNEWDGCKKIAEDVFSEYRASSFAFQNTDIEELDEEEQEEIKQARAFDEPYCLTKTYLTACLGTKILETCGFEAFNNSIEIFIGFRWENIFCGKENPFMKGFIDFLSNENKIVESVLIRTMFQIDDE